MIPDDSCPGSESVSEAARAGRSSDEPTDHVARCDSCGESSTAIRWMMELGQTVDSGTGPLPDPGLIWLKARIRKRSEVSWRTLLLTGIACGASAIGLGAILAGLPGANLAGFPGAILAGLPTEAWRSLQDWLTSAGIPGWEFPDLVSPGPLAIAWMPAAVLLMLLLLFTASEA